MKGSWERYLDKDVNDSILIAYGYGDGGGGPTRDMLETLKRMKKVCRVCPKSLRAQRLILKNSQKNGQASGKRVARRTVF